MCDFLSPFEGGGVAEKSTLGLTHASTDSSIQLYLKLPLTPCF